MLPITLYVIPSQHRGHVDMWFTQFAILGYRENMAKG
jgi:hypothetical protein